MEHEFNRPYLTTFLRLRKAVGFLGFFFPIILMAGAYLFGNCKTIQASISDYYYTIVGDVFVGIIFAISFFLIAYKGYDAKDQWLTNSAGFFSILAALLPTSQNLDPICSTRIVADSETRSIAHYASAAIFFMLLAYISYFQFTKSSGGMTPEKRERNRVYRICAMVMVGAVILVPVLAYFPLFPQSTFWLEWIAVAAFGISWLTKGELIMADK